MKILFTQISEAGQKDFFQQELVGHEVVCREEKDLSLLLQERNDWEIISPFVGTTITAQHLAQLPQLRLITTRSTGFDHIDLDAARERGVVVCNVPHYGSNTVAEHTIALLLSLARRLKETWERINEGKFDYHGLRGWDVKGKILGIIGGGNIGLQVARIAVGLGMEVWVYDLHPDPAQAQRTGFQYVEWEKLLRGADIITLHLPLNEKTYHLLGEKEFAQMKEGVYLINTARGGLIDTSALIKALETGKVAGAGLDVLEEEDLLQEDIALLTEREKKEKLLNLIANHWLMHQNNVIITPHNAFNSHEAIQRILKTTVANIRTFLQGKPQNVVAGPGH